MSTDSDAPIEGGERVIIRDKRRVDPQSGEVREVDPAAVPGWGAQAGDGGAATPQAAELLGDLQRLKAEFDNYRKRVDRDRERMAEAGVGGVIAALVPVLDDVDRAREHDELVGAFKTVADTLDATLGKLGLTRFGAVGDPFDPTLHEAVSHAESPEVGEPTCVAVLRPGYQLGQRLLRPAMVAVAGPPDDAAPMPADTASAND